MMIFQKIITSLLFICLINNTYAQYTLTSNDVVFSNGTITKFLNSIEKDIIIPNNFEGDTVKAIGNDVFSFKNLTSVKIPNTVTLIGYSSFRSNNFTEVIIPETVKSIDRYAFMGNDLTETTIPEGITAISSSAFFGNKLTKVNLPNTIKLIDDYAFRGNALTEITIPTSTLEIQYSAFAYNNLKTLIIPNSVYEIEEIAFANNDLTSLTISNNLNIIEKKVFLNNKLTHVDIPNSVTKIMEGAFSKNLLTSVSLPTSINYIAMNAFQDNPDLTSLILPQLDGYYWIDGNGNRYETGSAVNDFSTYYSRFEKSYYITKNINNQIFKSSYTVNSNTISISNYDHRIEGYTQEGWYLEPEFINQITKIPSGSTGDIEIFAKIFPTEYHIYYYLFDGTTTNPSNYNIESIITLSNASKDGYIFEGWFWDKLYQNQVTEIPRGTVGNKSLVAKFSPIQHKILYVLDGGETTNPISYTSEDATILLSDATKQEHYFEGWYSDSSYTNQVLEITNGSKGDIELYAKFSKKIVTNVQPTNNTSLIFSPNPSQDFIYSEATIVNLKILNAQGTTIKKFVDASKSFDLTDLASGIYILQATDIDGKKHTLRLIKN